MGRRMKIILKDPVLETTTKAEKRSPSQGTADQSKNFVYGNRIDRKFCEIFAKVVAVFRRKRRNICLRNIQKKSLRMDPPNKPEGTGEPNMSHFFQQDRIGLVGKMTASRQTKLICMNLCRAQY